MLCERKVDMPELICSVCGSEIYDGEEYYDLSGIIEEEDYVCECCLPSKFSPMLQTNLQDNT